MSSKWTETSISRLISLRQKEGLSWDKLTKHFPGFTANALRKTFYRYDGIEQTVDPLVESLKATDRARKQKSVAQKQNLDVIRYLEKRQDLLTEIKDLISEIRFTKPVIQKASLDKTKRKMTMEVMLTDLHYGKKSKTFNIAVAKKRMEKLGRVVLSEYSRYNSLYNVERIVTFMGGDMIENSDFHGMESRRACEFGNSEQVVHAIKSIYEHYIVPIVSTGKKCTFICVTGNHDRLSHENTYQDPGKENLTWIIYNMLADMCRLAGYKNIEFIIPEGVYHVLNIYGSDVLYEHGDHMKGGVTRKSCEAHLSKRSKQVGKLIRFFRLGHYHEMTSFGRGRIIVNASLAGQDGYSEINGYDSEASQTINYYIETKDRTDPFYHSFPVCLE